MAQRPAVVSLLGVMTTAAVALFIYFAEASYNGVPFLSYRIVYVSLPNIGHLQQHDSVEIAGVDVGQVLKESTRDDRALVELQLHGVGPVPVDSKVMVRANGLLGSRFVELDPGTSHRMLPNGGTITEANASTYSWGVPETLNLFDPKTRTALGNMLNGVGEGLEGRGSQLNRAIAVGPSSGHDLDAAAYAILDRPGAAQRFLPQLSSGFTALNDTGENLTGTFHPAAVTARAVVDEHSAIDQTIAELPRSESDIDYAFAPSRGLRFWNSTVTLSRALSPVLPKVPTALRSVVALLRRAPAPLRETRPVLDQVPSAGRATLRILASLKPDLAPLHQAFTQLVNPVSILAEHGCDIQSFATGLTALTSWGTVPGGHWGPLTGFPVAELISPMMANDVANTHQRWPEESGYNAPCAYSPGPVFTQQTLVDLLAGVAP